MASLKQGVSAKQSSVVGENLTVEGKVRGIGNVEVAGRFKGEVNVDGNLTIARGAHVSGNIKAENIIIKGEIEGDAEASSRVELLESGTVKANLKASTVNVAAGSRMRGNLEFGKK